MGKQRAGSRGSGPGAGVAAPTSTSKAPAEKGFIGTLAGAASRFHEGRAEPLTDKQKADVDPTGSVIFTLIGLASAVYLFSSRFSGTANMSFTPSAQPFTSVPPIFAAEQWSNFKSASPTGSLQSAVGHYFARGTYTLEAPERHVAPHVVTPGSFGLPRVSLLSVAHEAGLGTAKWDQWKSAHKVKRNYGLPTAPRHEGAAHRKGCSLR